MMPAITGHRARLSVDNSRLPNLQFDSKYPPFAYIYPRFRVDN